MKLRSLFLATAIMISAATVTYTPKAHALIGLTPGANILVPIGAVLATIGIVGGNHPMSNTYIWGGLILMDEKGNEVQTSELLKDNYGADEKSAERIANRLHNKLIEATKDLKGLTTEEIESLDIKISLSRTELERLSTEEFRSSEGFERLVNDLE